VVRRPLHCAVAATPDATKNSRERDEEIVKSLRDTL
jgi:hypothetical protein